MAQPVDTRTHRALEHALDFAALEDTRRTPWLVASSLRKSLGNMLLHTLDEPSRSSELQPQVRGKPDRQVTWVRTSATATLGRVLMCHRALVNTAHPDFNLGFDRGRFGGRKGFDAVAAKAVRVADDRQGGQRHRGGGDHR
jgi:hypothetical protein